MNPSDPAALKPPSAVARAESGARRGKRSGYASAKNRLERHVLPKLVAVRIRDVTADQVRRLHRALKETPVEANRTLTALSAVFGYADRAELVPAVRRIGASRRRAPVSARVVADHPSPLHPVEELA